MPYWGLRDYGQDGQLGLEPTPEQYVANLVEVFREVRRALSDDGTLWLNLGDSYAGSGKGPSNEGKPARNMSNTAAAPNRWQSIPAGVKSKDLVGIPWMVAFALRADGWYLRSEIIWHKPAPMPESVQDRPTKSHEQLFLLTKNARYFYDAEAIREEATDALPHSPGKSPYAQGFKTRSVRAGIDTNGGGQGEGEMSYPLHTRNKRSVWTVNTTPFPGAHFATFPPKLIEPCILAGSAEGDTILDPFAGAATTGLVATRLDRSFIGIELSPDYCKLGEDRILDDAPLLNSVTHVPKPKPPAAPEEPALSPGDSELGRQVA